MVRSININIKIIIPKIKIIRSSALFSTNPRKKPNHIARNMPNSETKKDSIADKIIYFFSAYID